MAQRATDARQSFGNKNCKRTQALRETKTLMVDLRKSPEDITDAGIILHMKSVSVS